MMPCPCFRRHNCPSTLSSGCRNPGPVGSSDFLAPLWCSAHAPLITKCSGATAPRLYIIPAHKRHQHLRAQTGQEGPRPRVDSPVYGPLPVYHLLSTSLRSAAHAVPGSGPEFSDISPSPKSVASRSVFRKAGPLSSPRLGL
jgi:hypothetical protein